jgi:hypothetical protein
VISLPDAGPLTRNAPPLSTTQLGQSNLRSLCRLGVLDTVLQRVAFPNEASLRLRICPLELHASAAIVFTDQPGTQALDS